MIDLKAANADLAAAIAALESQEHIADLREWAQARLRVNELDERISSRMKAKIHAHSAIVEAWGMPVAIEAPVEVDLGKAKLDTVNEPIEPVLSAAAWDTHHAASVGTYALSGDEVPEAVCEPVQAE